MLKLLLLSCLAFGLALGDDAGVIHAETDGRYYFYNLKVNWFKAVELCYQVGKRLATFNNEMEYNQLINLIREKNGANPNRDAGHWTSGSDLGRTGRYVWMTTGTPFKYTRWYEGEPNNGHSWRVDEVEHCVEIQADYDYRMNDSMCSKKNFVICENNN